MGVKERFGGNVRRLRDERGWKQQDLAQHSRVAQGQISAIESGHGKGSGFSPKSVEKFAAALGVDYEELFRREPGTGLRSDLAERCARWVEGLSDADLTFLDIAAEVLRTRAARSDQ